MLAILGAFAAGFLSLALLELSFLFLLLRRYLLARPSLPPSSMLSSPLLAPQTKGDQKPPSPRLSLQGEIWIATVPSPDAEAIRKNVEFSEKSSKEFKKKKDATKDVLQIHPVRAFARVEGQTLFVTADEGDEEAIYLDGFDVRAVSGGSEVSRKWAKKYPIRLQSGKSIYSQKSTFFVYLETSRKKEIWCQVLRAASGLGRYTEDTYIHLKEEFECYWLHLNEVYPALWLHQQTSGKDGHHKREAFKHESAGISKKRLLWKKFARKNSSKGSNREDKIGVTAGEISHSAPAIQPLLQDDGELPDKMENQKYSDGSSKSLSKRTSFKNFTTEIMNENGSLSENSSVKSYNRVSSGVDTCADMSDGSLDEGSPIHMSNISVDQGTLCWNMLFSRLFFDFYHSDKFKVACKQLVQKQISKVTVPSYIGNISCTNLDLGTIPPFLYRMHALPMNADGEWAVEADLDYSGGALLTVETRLDVCDSISQEKVVSESFEPTLAGAAAADLLKSVEDLETDRITRDEMGAISNPNKGSNSRSRISKMSKSASRGAWVQSSKARLKSVLSHVAEQVSQVPLTLSVRITSLKGTLRISLKSPPSDCIWFTFISMPDIELQPEPSIGDHKISTGPLADFIANRIKISLNDLLVLPNSQDISIPELLSDNNDWLPEAAAPFPWSPLDIHRSVSADDVQATTLLKTVGETGRSYQFESLPAVSKQKSFVKETGQMIPKSTLTAPSSSKALPILTDPSLTEDNSELIGPLLDKTNPSSEENDRIQAHATALSDTEVNVNSQTIGEGKKKQGSRRAKMLNFGRKVGERFDEKTRNVLEKVWEGLEKSDNGSTTGSTRG